MSATPTAPTSTLEERLDGLTGQLDEVKAELRLQREQREAYEELFAELAPVLQHALALGAGGLADLEQRGYLSFARSSLGVVDRVVTSFGEEDVTALGDNIVLILETVKEMTQPEVMALLRQTVAEVNDPADATAEPPTIRRLLREFRDPEVRLGLARLLAVLRAVGAGAPDARHPTPDPPENDDREEVAH